MQQVISGAREYEEAKSTVSVIQRMVKLKSRLWGSGEGMGEHVVPENEP